MKTINNYIAEHMFSGKKISKINQTKNCVDFDLPSGTLWCTHNVGASKPEELGDYFAFGETKSKSEYTEDTLNNVFVKNGKKVNRQEHLFPEEDAAHVIMGGDWQMPTSAQVEELLGYTKQTPETIINIDGIKFVSIKDESKFIFFPFAGYKDGTRKYGTRGANIWVNDDIKSTSDAYFYFITKSEIKMFTLDMSIGLSIRPVINKK